MIKSEYIELEKDYEGPVNTLHLTFGATVHQDGTVEGHEVYIGAHNKIIYLTHLFNGFDLATLDDEFLDELNSQLQDEEDMKNGDY